MPRVLRSIFALVTLLAALGGGAAGAAPLFTLSEDGRTFLYTARPGDHPGVVAEMFSIPPGDVDAFLRASGITDPTRIGAGFVYRIPNPVVVKTERLEAENARLTRTAAEAEERARTLEQEAKEARTSAASAEREAARLAGLEPRWSMAKVALIVLVLALAGTAAVATAAVRRQQEADRFARTLAEQLESKNRALLAERQESARRALELENRIRTLEAQLGPRVVVGGR